METIKVEIFFDIRISVSELLIFHITGVLDSVHDEYSSIESS